MDFLDLNATSSPVGRALADLMDKLRQNSLVESAALASADGLPLEMADIRTNQLAAAVGFLMANAQQTCANLSLKDDCFELIVRQDSGRLLVCHSFQVDNGRLILAVLLKENGAYQRLLEQTIRQAQRIVNQR
jgi:predicted regulator of Ras-like GTPase activity (Roadblock/LC7/MglB family)